MDIENPSKIRDVLMSADSNPSKIRNMWFGAIIYLVAGSIGCAVGISRGSIVFFAVSGLVFACGILYIRARKRTRKFMKEFDPENADFSPRKSGNNVPNQPANVPGKPAPDQ
jgi:hypothetical protein